MIWAENGNVSFVQRMIQIWSIGTVIWFRSDKKCGRTDGIDGRMHGRRQKYIPLTSSVDKEQAKSNGK